MSGSTDINVDRLLSDTWVARVEYRETLGSTQDEAQRLAKIVAAADLPLLVIAEQQTAGRGRGANRWWTAPGSLAFSLVFDPARWHLARSAVPQRSLAVAVALVDALAPRLDGFELGLHWPNDVFVEARKLAGILIDVLPDGRHILGVGLNVNNNFQGAPDEVRRRAASLSELTGRSLNRSDLLVDLLASLDDTLGQSAGDDGALGPRFQQLCLQVGQDLLVAIGTERLRGRCLGIAPDGALLLDTPGGVRSIYSGALCHA